MRLTPEAAFSHPFIAKAVNELKCLRQGGEKDGARTADGEAPRAAAPNVQ